MARNSKVTPIPKGRPLGKNSIRAWRKHRELSLEALADRVRELDGEMTGASLSRIERSIQPYNQRTLEAIAVSLNCTPADLVMREPPNKTHVDLLTVIGGIPEESRQMALDMLQVLSKKSTPPSVTEPSPNKRPFHKAG